MNPKTQQGIVAIKEGNKLRARQFLREAIDQDPGDVQAWLWLSGAVETDQERVQCLQRVLRLDPDNPVAAKGLAKLVARGTVTVHVDQETPNATSPEAAPVNTRLKPQLSPRTASTTPTRSTTNKTVFTAKPSLIPVFVGGMLLAGIFVMLWSFTMNLLPEGEVWSLLRWILGLILVFYALVTACQWTLALIRRLFARYTLTERHLIIQKGVLSRSRKTIPVPRIQDVASHQRFLERLFDIGDVIVESAGERGAIRLMSLPHCQEYAEQILRTVQRYDH